MSWRAGRVVHGVAVSSLWDRNKKGEDGAEDVPLLSLTVAGIRGFHLPFFVPVVLRVQGIPLATPGFVIPSSYVGPAS